MPLNQTAEVTNALVEAYGIATEKRNEFLTPEHLLAGFLKDRDFWEALNKCGNAQELETNIYGYINGLDRIQAGEELAIEFSEQLQEVFETAAQAASSAMAATVHTHHVIYAYFHLEESFARYHFENCLESSIPDFLNSLIDISGESADRDNEMLPDEKWVKYFTPVQPYEELVGRKEEIAKTLRVLCRKTKSNVLLTGGRGVGKTAIARGLAHLLDKDEVPEKLKGCELMELNTAALLSGTQYRGDLEGRVQSVMGAIAVEEGIIVYVDELRSLGGMSKMDDGSKDILSLLVPYLKSGDVRFIISATPEDIKKLTSNDAGALGLFRQIDVDEPSDTEAEKILKGIMPSLSQFHEVKYDKDVISHAVSMSRRYMLDRCLPDKAIDLLDEAGAYAHTHGDRKVSVKTVDKALADICRIDVQASDEGTKGDLYNMEERLSGRIYGQEKAIRTVTEAILMSKAGLLDRNKTIGNFLYVGPTGVGKTALSKVLAETLHVPLHRFDMSEYSEKHSVAKLIGSPAGYVG